MVVVVGCAKQHLVAANLVGGHVGRRLSAEGRERGREESEMYW